MYLYQNVLSTVKRPILKMQTKSPVSLIPKINTNDISQGELILAAQRANIIDDYDNELLYKKLRLLADQNIKTILIHAVDDEPLCCKNSKLVHEHYTEIHTVLLLLKKVFAVNDAQIILYSAFDEIKSLFKNRSDLIFLKGGYPVFHRVTESALKAMKIKKPDFSQVAVLGVESLYHLYMALFDFKPQATRFVSVMGDCVLYPQVIEAPLNTSVFEVLKACGLADDPKLVSLNGSLRGTLCTDLSTEISYTTKYINAFLKEPKTANDPCIGCGRCTEVCPQKLLPNYIYKEFYANNILAVKKLNPYKCIGCGLCSYVCPSKIDLAFIIGKLSKS